MRFTFSQQQKFQDIFSFFSKKMTEIRHKRLVVLRAFEEKKKKREHRDILEKIIKL